MTYFRSNQATVRSVTWIVLPLLIASSMTEFSAAQTASAAANQRRTLFTQKLALSPANSPNPSSLGAISASVDAAVDWRVNADRENQLTDPGLSPLRITAPNVNGEDEPSAQPQLETLTPLRGGGAKYSGFTPTPFSTSTSIPVRVQNPPVLSGRPVDSLKKHRPSIYGSDRIGSTDTTSSAPTPIPEVRKDRRRTRVHGKRPDKPEQSTSWTIIPLRQKTSG